MSGLDPLAALVSQAADTALFAETSIDLGALLDAFQAQVAVGDILTATVLPPDGGVDRVQLFGQTLPAQLPPGINPGASIALQVTGFTPSAIVVRNLGPVGPDGALPEAPELPPLPESVPQRATLSGPAPPAVPPQAAASTPVRATPPPVAPPPVAPPREIFVAASVRPVPVPVAPPNASVPPRASAFPIGFELVDDVPVDIEARIAASRTGALAAKTPPAPEPPAAPVPAKTAQPQTPSRSVPVAPPLIRSGQSAPEASSAVVPRAAAAQASAVPPTPQARLLALLRVPLTPTTLAAARAIDGATRALTTAFERLDAALQQRGSATIPLPPGLRSLVPFLARLDLRNAHALPEQIAAYVSNVVSGGESKLAQLIRALEPLPSAPFEPPSAAAPPQAESNAQQPEPNAPLAPLAPQALAQAAERSVALEHDVKNALLQLTATGTPGGIAPQAVAAARDALVALTAVQLGTLQSQQNDPNSVTIPLPAYFHEGGQPAQLRVRRDAPDGKRPLDADNFHISFVLDTASMGTIAIDVQTVGRAVSVDVRAEGARSADRFRATLDDLRARLERLRYRVASMAASTVKSPAPAVAANANVAAQVRPSDRDARLDLQA